jgi:hypothetical protein
MKSRWVIAVVLVVLTAAGATAWWVLRSGGDGEDGFAACAKAGNPVADSYPRQCRNSKGKIFSEDVSGATLESKGGVSVLVSSPKSDAIVSNPIRVKGKVPGSWSFEANFGVELLDAHRTSVATSYATVDGNWMTEKDVTFTALVPFKPPSTKTGYLVLRKANPSDIEGKADSVEIPIRFR